MLNTHILLFLTTSLQAAVTPDWSPQSRIPSGQHRANVYQLNPVELAQQVVKGKEHALIYPVETTKLLLPYGPLKNFLQADEKHPLKKIVETLTRKKIDIRSEEAFYQWLGLPSYPASTTVNIFSPFFVPPTPYSNMAMGAALVQGPDGKGLTFSCTACHSQQLFGRPVIGLPSKRPRSNELFLMGKKYTPHIPTTLFALTTGATTEETDLFHKTKQFIQATDGRIPQALGLDTSLAQVARSLAHREPDAYASYSKKYQKKPRPNLLDHHIADSRPMPWWNVKYKTRWLSDGSVVSGNPILTNILWNEIGRGVDMHELKRWIEQNEDKIKQLTAAVFSTEAPHWNDYFSADSIDESLARKGEALFVKSCTQCHGGYEKWWSHPTAPLLPKKQRLLTRSVHYFEQTPIKNVGTDPGRYQGTKAIADSLNRLAVSQYAQTVIVPQEGYVPPPLVGIWSRYPYFHNNSIPNLCALLTPATQRVKQFYQGPADDPERDFDQECVGYPVGERIPSEWKKKEALFDTNRTGLSNQGHDKMLLNSDGSERFGQQDKRALIEFLKTL